MPLAVDYQDGGYGEGEGGNAFQSGDWFMNPMFADAIDFPLVLMYGLAVLVPLLLFQVGVEALILRYMWQVPFREMARFTFRANCWSLLAGIPTKILNFAIYSLLLPRNIPEFFARYPFAVGVGTFIYFVVTVLVELGCAFRWRRVNAVSLTRRSLWKGILLANLATYVVMAPLHYYATRPMNDVREFTRDARWSSHPDTQVVYTDSVNGHLKITRLGGAAVETIVPASVKDYLISSNAIICLFRTDEGGLALYQRNSGRSNLVWQTGEHYTMNQVAFSPSAERVAFASENDSSIEVVEIQTARRTHHQFKTGARDFNVVWSPEEAKFYVSHDRGNRFTAHITPEFSLTIETMSDTNEPPLLACYGRTGPHQRFSYNDWGQTYSSDTCGDLRAWAGPGLDSGLQIFRDGTTRQQIFNMAVNPGLLHLSVIFFKEVAFLEGCKECLFEAEGCVYLIDLEKKRLGTVATGERFSLLTPRYRKRF